MWHCNAYRRTTKSDTAISIKERQKVTLSAEVPIGERQKVTLQFL